VIFVDASALIAIITGEPGADLLADRLESDVDRLCSAMSVWETVAGLSRSYSFAPAAAQLHVERFRAALRLRLVVMGEVEMNLALEAYGRYGRGCHKAALNMGDCFAYGCARAHGARLLYLGEDFAQTELAWAE
jgi:ribonuclease VapC